MPSVVGAFVGQPEEPDHNEQYVERMVAELGLDARQRRMLRIVLEKTSQEEFAVFRANIDRLPDSLQAEVVAVGRRQVARVREILDDGQRVRFDKMDPSRQLGEVK